MNRLYRITLHVVIPRMEWLPSELASEVDQPKETLSTRTSLEI